MICSPSLSTCIAHEGAPSPHGGVTVTAVSFACALHAGVRRMHRSRLSKALAQRGPEDVAASAAADSEPELSGDDTRGHVARGPSR